MRKPGIAERIDPAGVSAGEITDSPNGIFPNGPSQTIVERTTPSESSAFLCIEIFPTDRLRTIRLFERPGDRTELRQRTYRLSSLRRFSIENPVGGFAWGPFCKYGIAYRCAIIYLSTPRSACGHAIPRITTSTPPKREASARKRGPSSRDNDQVRELRSKRPAFESFSERAVRPGKNPNSSEIRIQGSMFTDLIPAPL